MRSRTAASAAWPATPRALMVTVLERPAVDDVTWVPPDRWRLIRRGYHPPQLLASRARKSLVAPGGGPALPARPPSPAARPRPPFPPGERARVVPRDRHAVPAQRAAGGRRAHHRGDARGLCPRSAPGGRRSGRGGHARARCRREHARLLQTGEPIAGRQRCYRRARVRGSCDRRSAGGSMATRRCGYSCGRRVGRSATDRELPDRRAIRCRRPRQPLAGASSPGHRPDDVGRHAAVARATSIPTIATRVTAKPHRAAVAAGSELPRPSTA